MMQTLKIDVFLSTLWLAVSLHCEAQSNVYSLSVYSGGTSYRYLCVLSLPFSPYRYALEERSWREDTNGLTIIDVRRKPTPSDVSRRSLEVQFGRESFVVPFDSISTKKITSGSADKPGVKESGNLAMLVMKCATNRGGYLITNTPPAIEASWVRHSREMLEFVVADGDHFTEVQKFLEQAYGPPDVEFRSPVPPEISRSFTYSPRQIGTVLIVTADSKATIVSVLSRQKQ